MYLPIPLGLLGILFLVLTFNAISAPIEVEQVVTTQILKQDVSFDYTAIPKVSTLYPAATSLGKQPTYLVNLTDQFNLSMTANVVAPEGMQVHGTHKVIMRLNAGGLWTKDYVLSKEQTFSGSGEFAALDLQVTLPIEELLTFGVQVGKEAGTTPSSYTLTILPYVSAEVVSETTKLMNEFTPSFAFELSSLQLKPKGLPKERYAEDSDPAQDLFQSNSVSQPVTQIVPNQLVCLGVHLLVPAARVLNACLAVLFSYLTIWLVITNSKRRPNLSEAEMIQKRYGGKIVEVKYGSLGLGKQQLQLGSFQSLLTLADEREKSIIYTTNIDGVANNHTYYLIDADIAYFYSIAGSSEVPC